MSLAMTQITGGLRDLLAAHGQEHVLCFWDQLDALGRRRLERQVRSLDLAGLSAARRTALALAEARAETPGPAPVLALPEHGGDPALRRQARERGETLLAEGAVAALVVAGGQGTRLGHPGPKGSFPIGPVSGRSLFGLQAQKIRGLNRRYRARLPWLVMTSPGNDAETRALFVDQDWFGLEPEDVSFFSQREMPCLDFSGRLMLARPDCLATAPDGHGGVVPALTAAGLLPELHERGIRALSYYQVDNPLVRIGDPELLGLLGVDGAEIASKAVRKRAPEERVGSLARSGGRTRVIEYTEIRDPERSARDADGELLFWAGAIGIHAFALDFLMRMAVDPDRTLPYHASPKRISCLDARGRPIPPSNPNGIKLERFVFDLLPHARACSLVEVRRNEEYSPVKNAEGGESPATARMALDRCVRDWLREAGVAAPAEYLTLEVDHARIDEPDDARALGISDLAEAPELFLTGSGGRP